MKIIESIFSNNLRKILKQKNILQKQFALSIGVSKSTVSYWITGRQLPEGPTINKIMLLLSISSDDLFRSDDKMKPTN